MNKKFTLEQRIARLERLLKNEARTRKFESYESNLDVDGARANANSIADQFCRMIGVDGATLDDLGDDVIESPVNGWLTVDQYELCQQDPETRDPDARFAFQYSLDGTDGEYTIIVYPTDKSVCLQNDGGLYIDPDGNQFTDDNGNIVAFSYPNDWEGFNLSMVDYEGDGYNVEAGDDFRSYRGMLRKHESRQSVINRIARLEKLLSRKSR